MLRLTHNKKKLANLLESKEAELITVEDKIEEVREELSDLEIERDALENEIEEIKTRFSDIEAEETTDNSNVYNMTAKNNPRPKSEKSLTNF